MWEVNVILDSSLTTWWDDLVEEETHGEVVKDGARFVCKRQVGVADSSVDSIWTSVAQADDAWSWLAWCEL